MVLLCVCVCDLTAFDGSATSGKSIHTYTLWDWLMKSSRVILIKQAGNLQAEITEMWWFTYIHTCRLNIYIHQPATTSKRTNRWNTYIDILVKISLAVVAGAPDLTHGGRTYTCRISQHFNSTVCIFYPLFEEFPEVACHIGGPWFA